ncbi:MAG: hypothetical protein QOC55_2334 [Thermoleophilaceae bacterium]|nr:hypothetical protein [Thermoleophilaceae bacterium]
MPPDDDVPGGDWEFPPVDPADDLIGFAPEPALPEPTVPAFLPAAATAPPEPEPLPADPFAGIGAPLLAAIEEPPSTGVLPVPRRSSLPGTPVSPVRALAGAAVAVAGVLLGIGALLWATDAPKGSPALQQTQAQSSVVSPAPSPSELPSPSPEPTTAVAAPLTSPTAAPSPAAAPKLALTVLNNSNVNQLAHRAAAKYRAMGWPIKLEGAFRGRVPVTTVYYAPGQLPSAQLLQKEFPAIQRVRPRFSTLPGSGLTVVLTRDYPA